MSNAETVTQYATFVVDELFFGIDVLRVQEVLRYQKMTRVPLSPAVAEVVNRALACRAEDRWPSAGAMQAALKQAMPMAPLTPAVRARVQRR